MNHLIRVNPKILILTSLIIIYPRLSVGTSYQCQSLFNSDTESAPVLGNESHPLMMDLNRRVVRVEALLQITNAQFQRQWRKKITRLSSLVEEFVVEGDLSEKKMTTLLELGNELAQVELRLLEMESFFQLDPRQFLRALLTQEPILPGFEYTADLPGFGEITLKFSDEVASFLNSSNLNFTNFVPYIFNGLVGKKGKDGIKNFTGEHNRHVDIDSGLEFTLMELKNAGLNSRIIVVYTSDGTLHFIRFIKNHKRVEYVAKARFLPTFIQNFNFPTPRE